MTAKRISYHCLLDMLYTMLWAIFIMTTLVITLQLIIHPGKALLTPIIALNGLFVPLITIFIGLRPVLSLFVKPDTIYIDNNNRLFLKNNEQIYIEHIEKINVKQIGVAQSHLIYYEIILNVLPNILHNKKRKSLIVVEPYKIRHIFQTRLDFISIVMDLGLKEEKIVWDEWKWKHMFGIRDKFNK